ncbi:MAG: selenide, water dikinase SelD [Alcanivorax sp.]|nr:selenide, water dikinase SelD [Alcanivorax sp.]
MTAPIATTPAQYDLVLVGGGHSHALTLRMLAMKALPNVRLTLISPDSLSAYSGMLPGLVAGHYQLDETHIDLHRLCLASGCRFIRASVSGIDRQLRQLQLDDGSRVSYDWLSLDVGALPDLQPVQQARQRAEQMKIVPVKPVAGFYRRWQQLLGELDHHPQPRLAVVGGGAGGTEMALALACALKKQTGQPGNVSLLTAGELLASQPTAVRRRMRRRLARLQVNLHEHCRVDSDEHGQLRANQHPLAADFLLWCTGVRALPWLVESGLECDQRGFVRVRETLQSRNDPRIFAAGDCAAFPHPLPKAGVYAVRQANTLAANLRAAITGQPLRRYRPQRRFLSLLSAGGRDAVGSRGGPFDLAGRWVWHWKDRIDRAFMDKFANGLPTMTMPAMTAPEQAMHCAGCGAKVGSQALSEALADLQPVINAGIEAGVAQADDAAIIQWPAGRKLVQSLDYFPAFIDQPYLFGRIAVLHSLSDLYAMNATPHSALANVCLPWLHPRLQQRDLQRLMAGALRELNDAGCTLVGGHTIEGPQLAAGFTVNGSAAPDKLWHKGGARPGDVLIMTKSLGTGIQLASLMHGKARGPWLDDTLDSMLQSNRLAWQALQDQPVQACTDITGFGLLGHLLELCQQSAVDAELLLDRLPLLPGTDRLLDAGVVSTLFESNRQVLAACRGRLDDNDPQWLAACDPQTSGGLLVAMAPQEADAVLKTLKKQGVRAAIIGQVIVKEGKDSAIMLT